MSCECFRFLDSNYALSGQYASRYFSSENTLFPFTNVEDIYRRSKVWRTAGYWDLSAGTPSIVFREQAGVDITATLAASEYTTDASFLNAIKTALEAVGVATYTVSRDTTSNKIKILSALDGGATVFELRFATSTFMAGILGFDTVNLSGAASYIADVLKIHTYEYVLWDLGIPTNPKHVIAAALRNSPLKFSLNAVIKLQGNETNAWSGPSYEATFEFNDYVLALENKDGLHTEGLRYWRLYIEDPSNPLGYIELSLLFLGNSWAPSQGGVQYGMTGAYIDRSDTVYSEGGQDFTDIREPAEQFSLNMDNLTKTDKEYFDDLYNTFKTGIPLFLSMDMNEAYSTDFQSMIRYCKFASAPRWTLKSFNNYRLDVDMREIL